VFEPDEAADLIAAAVAPRHRVCAWLAGIRMHALDSGWFLQSRQYPERGVARRHHRPVVEHATTR
jgi:hypothetical protein